MTNSTQYILQHLFGAGRLEDVSVDQLKELVNEYPSFNAGHYLLSIKLQKEKDETFLPETQKTALYFHNPFWLQWMLEHAEEKQGYQEAITNNIYEKGPGYTEPYVSETTSFITHIEEIKEEYYSATKQTEEVFHQTYITEISASPEQAETIKAEEPQPEIQSLNDTVEETLHSTYTTENPVITEPPETIKEEYHAAEMQQEEHVQEITSAGNLREEHFFENQVIENPVLERYIETAKEENPLAAIQNEEVQEIHASNDVVEDFHETYITENPVFEEHAEPIKKEYHPAPIQNEEAVQEINAANNPVEDFHETYITENPVFEEHAEPIKEEYHPAPIQNEEAVQEINTVNNPAEDFHETHITENPVFEEQAEAIKGEYHPARENEGIVQEVSSSTVETKDALTEMHTAGHNGEEIKETHHPQPAEKEERSTTPDQVTNSDEQITKPGTVSLPAVTGASQEPKTFELTFEPYHTIDYFASQGIKFIQEENPTDKFGKQLKTFTDWLKQMKRLPHQPLPEDPDDTSNAEIEIIAANSIEEKDVETETMAEVLAKQGKTDKAIELYLKLSLLNPTKIAYFAAKIEHIKRTSL